jgi:hypothetical protein
MSNERVPKTMTGFTVEGINEGQRKWHNEQLLK